MTGVPGEPEIGGWLADYVGELLAVPGSEIDRDATFGSFGVDSATAIIITGELQDWLKIPISPDVAEDYPTIRSLGGHLATLVAAKDGRDGRGH